jgi:RNA polymerase sigma factor (sigma-70 family)
MTRHLAIDTVRKRKPTVLLDESMTMTDDYSDLEVFDMLNRLDEDERQIVTYRVYAKMPHKEIARVMGISLANSQKKYQRAIQKLKGNYNHEYKENYKTT